MANLEELESLLTAGAAILDTAASQIRDIPLEPAEDHIRTIGEALSLIFQVQRAIYRIDPGLEPTYLKKPLPHPGTAKRFGDIILAAHDCEAVGDLKKAISIYERFISEDPPSMFVDMAQNQMQRIRCLISAHTAPACRSQEDETD